MASFQISHEAKLDLKQIWLYTADQWSEKQADKYYREIINEFKKLSKFPNSGKSINNVREGFRIGYIKAHMIIYKTSDTGIIINRILHQRMDIKRHL